MIRPHHLVREQHRWITRGPPGPPGPPGTAGSGAYVHTQGLPAATWTINHGLGFNPNVTVIDSTGTQCEGSISYPNTSTVVLTFSAGFSGVAYLS